MCDSYFVNNNKNKATNFCFICIGSTRAHVQTANHSPNKSRAHTHIGRAKKMQKKKRKLAIMRNKNGK